MTINPTPPQSLNAFAREILDLQAGHPDPGDIVIGGGVALAHSLEYRDTQDLDAWWRTGPTAAADALIMASKMTALVERGAPRDLRDIHELCRRGLISVETC